jgi:hypothetical protein
VRDHQKSAARRSDEFEREFQDVISRGFVEVARRLIGKQKTRARRKRPPDRDTLLLPHGKLLRIAGCQTFEPQPPNELVMPRWIETICDTRLKCEIITNRQTRDEVELLEHNPQGFAPKRGPVEIRKRRHQDAIQPDLAVIRLIKSSNEMQERTLPLPDSPISAKLEPARIRCP